ncbi:hypothetical protein F0562_009708 [Nyssa sinensis]|uniref:C2 NT-type domain-containing protein n=1 Tax=Nyssa sinensis TaxID=561372 RepID=A0A5J4ZWW0_9ASTE|nr:hypothetical protein F0562_009708 [Nyssa sinensis]
MFLYIAVLSSHFEGRDGVFDAIIWDFWDLFHDTVIQMLSKVEAGKKIGEDSGNGKLLHEIEAISKALYLDKTRSKNSISTLSNRSKSTGKPHLPGPKSKPKFGNEDPLHKDKKSSWSWKALKALTHVRNRRFNCCFSLQVHSIEGLPPFFDDLNLCVHWKRRDSGLMTHPARVFQGIAEFEEQLTHTCSVYGSRYGPHHSAKYEAKHFLLYASVFDAPQLDLGKHRVDLTRLLPLTLEELEEEKSSGKWTTSFKLSGKGKGATMNVSFGYSVVASNSIAPAVNRNVPEVLSLKKNHTSMVKHVAKFDQSNSRITRQHAGSLPARSLTSFHSVEEIKDLHEVLPTPRSEHSASLSMLYQKFDEEKLDIPVDYRPELDVFSESLEPLRPNPYLSDSGKENVESECEDGEFSITERGIELSSKEHVKSEEGILKVSDSSAVEESLGLTEIENVVEIALEEDTKLHPQVEELGSHRDELVVSDCISKENDICPKESLMDELESALNSMSDLVIEELNSQDDEIEIPNQENYTGVESNYEAIRKGKSLSLDAVTESVASEFFDMLGIEHSPLALSSESEPESPRERLLRQFEKDALAGGCSLFNFDIEDRDQAEFGYEAPTGSGCGIFSEDFNVSSAIQAAEDKANVATQAVKNKTRASVVEDLETEALMREWGLNEKAFQCSPPNSSGGFGSPIDLPLEVPLQCLLLDKA